jgi:hypothetical protein
VTIDEQLDYLRKVGTERAQVVNAKLCACAEFENDMETIMGQNSSVFISSPVTRHLSLF